MHDSNNTSTPVYVNIHPMRAEIVHYVHDSAGKFICKSTMYVSKKYLTGIATEVIIATDAAAQDELPFG